MKYAKTFFKPLTRRSAIVSAFSLLGAASALGACQATPASQIATASAEEKTQDFTASRKTQTFTVSSPLFEDQGTLPAGSKCVRDGGDGLSPPLAWSSVPDGTKSFAITMHHYSRRAQPGIDTPSHYWLLWDIPPETRALPRGNTQSVGFMGSDKDQRGIGYTPPCSPGGQAEAHAYTITVYALSEPATSLGQKDDPTVLLTTLQSAIEGKVIASSDITFLN